MPASGKRALFLGQNRTRTKRYLGVAVSLFMTTIGIIGFVSVLSQYNISVRLSGFWLAWTIVLISIGTPAIQAYQNDGLFVSIALGLAIPLAFYLVLTAFNLVYPSEDILWGLGVALLYGVPAGILGFLLGAGLHRIRRSV